MNFDTGAFPDSSRSFFEYNIIILMDKIQYNGKFWVENEIAMVFYTRQFSSGVKFYRKTSSMIKETQIIVS